MTISHAGKAVLIVGPARGKTEFTSLLQQGRPLEMDTQKGKPGAKKARALLAMGAMLSGAGLAGVEDAFLALAPGPRERRGKYSQTGNLNGPQSVARRSRQIAKGVLLSTEEAQARKSIPPRVVKMDKRSKRRYSARR